MGVSITQEVFEVVLAREVVAGGGGISGLMHLWWSAPEQGDRVVQVYLNGELVEVSQDPSQRELWLICDRSHAQRIELLAVPAGDPEGLWRSRSDLLGSCESNINSESCFSLVRDEQLPVDSEVFVAVDGQLIDSGVLWPASEHRGGFGSVFGLGGFGYDGITGPGLGRGELGMGPLGVDGTAWRWRRGDLEEGVHNLSVAVKDQGGQAVADLALLDEVTIEAMPLPATDFSIDSDYTLRWAF